MSLNSRSTGGRRGAKMAAVFATTLLTYLVMTAIPAQAASTCSYNGTDTIDVFIDTDDRAVLDPGVWFGGNYNLAVDGEPGVIDCGAAPGFGGTVGWVNIQGTDAGRETAVLYYPSAMWQENVTVDLGNGVDTLDVSYDETTWTDFFGTVNNLWDLSAGDALSLGTGAGGVGVGDMDFDNVADLRIDDAENVTVGGGFGDDFVDALLMGFDGAAVAYTVAGRDADDADGDIPEGTDAFDQAVVFAGGPQDDDFTSGAGNDTFLGAAGYDEVDFGRDNLGGVTVDLAAGTATGANTGTDVLSDVQGAWGTWGDDSLTGSLTDNNLHARAGDDHVSGGGGNDFLAGGQDDDHLVGGPGNDIVIGADGDDVLDEEAGANGADILIGNADWDVLDYSARTNPVYVEVNGGGVSGEGACPLGTTCEDDDVSGDIDEFRLGSAADTFVGDGTDSWVIPGLGDDDIDGGGSGGDDDTLDLSASATGATFDLINGTATSDQGTETIADIESAVGTDADDTMIIDENSDFVEFYSGGGVDLVDGSQALGDLLIELDVLGNGQEVENAIGGAGDDVIWGNILGNMLWGGDGNDFIDGLLGNDFIEGGAGNDLMNGNAGADALSYVDAPNGVIVDNQLGFASGHGDDAISFFEIVYGSDFDDEIIAGQTAEDYNQRLLGRFGDDILIGSNSSDLIKGGAGNDNIRGGHGDDDLVGAGGDDYLSGSNGDDYLRGGKGTDTGVGGKGADVCKGVEFPKSC